MIRSCLALGACALLGAAGCSTIDGRTDGGDATLRPVEQRLPRNDYASRWSPDGREILFTSRVEGVYWLHVLDLESGRVRRLVDVPPNQRGGTFSPYGSRIAFVARGPTDRPDATELYVMDADGSGLRRLTENSGSDGEVPAWSPDGRRVVFWSERDGNRDIYSIEADGTGLRRLTRHPAQDRHPSYSPDGGRIVFWSSRDGDPEIYVMPAKGGEARQLTRNEVYDGGPRYSPDGSRIVFFSNRGGSWGIWAMNADGSDPTRLTDARDWNFDPDWSPDGSRIVFDSRRDGRRGIYAMNADGSEETKLTNTEPSEFIAVARERGVLEAVRRYRQARERDPEAIFFYEAEGRNLGLDLLDAGHVEDAVRILEVTVEAYSRPAEGARPTTGTYRALAEAYRRAGRPAPPPGDEITERIRRRGPSVGLARLDSLRVAFPDWPIVSESAMNRLGYELLGAGRIEDAIAVFLKNVELYPGSSNVYDSLGEAYLAAADTARAVRFYEASLRIDPSNENGRAMLRRIRASWEEPLFREHAFAMNASWSSDGSRVVFASPRDGDPRPDGGVPYVELYVVDADGGEPRRLTYTPGTDEGGAAWSPDGSRIAFTTYRDGNGEIYLMAPDGSDLRNLTRSPGRDAFPTWSPDGARLAFASDRTGDLEIHVMNADGSGVRRLTRSPGFDSPGAWTPDGRGIIFFSRRDPSRGGDLYELDLAGGAVRRLTAVYGEAAKPSVSPDGDRIVFHWLRRDGGRGDIYTMRPDGSDRTRIFASPEWEFSPRYSPDGTRIVFDSRRDGRRGIYVMDADGSNLRKLTNRRESPIAVRIREEGARSVLADGSVARRLAAHPQAGLLEMELRELGMELLDGGRTDDALATLELAREIGPGGGDTDPYLARAYRRVGREAPPPTDEIVRAFEQGGVEVGLEKVAELRARYPDWHVASERLLTDMGRRYLAEERAGDAMTVLDEATRTYPGSAEVAYQLGRAREAAGREELAIRAYRRALELDVDHRRARRALDQLVANR